LCRFEGGQISVVQEAENLPHKFWIGIASTPDGGLYLRSEDSLWARRQVNGRFEEISLHQDPKIPQRLSLAPDPKGNLAITTLDGFAIYHAGVWETITEKSGLPRSAVTFMLADKEGNFWIGTNGQGLLRWVGFGQWSKYGNGEGLSDEYVWSLARDG